MSPTPPPPGVRRLDDFARRLIEAFWPGPLTIVAPVAATLPGQACWPAPDSTPLALLAPTTRSRRR